MKLTGDIKRGSYRRTNERAERRTVGDDSSERDLATDRTSCDDVLKIN